VGIKEIKMSGSTDMGIPIVSRRKKSKGEIILAFIIGAILLVISVVAMNILIDLVKVFW